MKTVIIPSNMNPWTCEINGMRFSYKAGSEQSVPDEVAELIEAYNESIPKEAEEDGEEGQVWTKEQYGAGWEDAPSGIPEIGDTRSKFLYVDHNGVVQWKGVNQVPSGGTVGQVLTKTADGEEWADAQGGGGSGDIADLSTEVQAFWDKMMQAMVSEEYIAPSFFSDEIFALNSAIKTAKTAGKQIVASVNYVDPDPDNDVTVASDVSGFSFIATDEDSSSFSFRFAYFWAYPFSEFRVLCQTAGSDFTVHIYTEDSSGEGSITMYRDLVFSYSSLPS